MEKRQVLLYDTTLRDGMQGQGMSLSAQEKVRVVRKLDELGVHFIEAGFPGWSCSRCSPRWSCGRRPSARSA